MKQAQQIMAFFIKILDVLSRLSHCRDVTHEGSNCKDNNSSIYRSTKEQKIRKQFTLLRSGNMLLKPGVDAPPQCKDISAVAARAWSDGSLKLWHIGKSWESASVLFLRASAELPSVEADRAYSGNLDKFDCESTNRS